MLIPYSSDAPIYHVPVITVTVIMLSVGIFFAPPIAEHFRAPDPAATRQRLPILEWAIDGGYNGPEEYKLQFGQGIKPWQGITSVFIHANLLHLVFCLVFLFLFGMIIEGKIGWWKFLPIYVAIAFLQGLLLQTMTMVMHPDFTGATYGASIMLFGLMGMAIIWSPVNSFQCVSIAERYRVQHEVDHIDVPLWGIVVFCFVLDILMNNFLVRRGGGSLPFTMLHAGAGLIGASFAIAMLKLHFVDCEGYDIFHVWAGTEGRPTDEESNANQKALIEQGLKQIRQILSEGANPQLAYRAHVSMTQKYEAWHLPDSDFLKIIKQLCDQNLHNEASLAMGEYLKTGRAKQPQVRLKLASILAGPMRHPSQALSVLLPIDYDQLSAKEKAIYDQTAAEAKALRASGLVDTKNNDW